jgi:hypothetical protein
VRRYYQCRAGIGGNALRNGEQKHRALADDLSTRQGSIYDNLKKYLAILPE